MSKIKRLLSVLVAALMLLTMPITTGISRAIAEGTTEPTETETPSEGVALEMEDLDPATLNVLSWAKLRRSRATTPANSLMVRSKWKT